MYRVKGACIAPVFRLGKTNMRVAKRRAIRRPWFAVTMGLVIVTALPIPLHAEEAAGATMQQASKTYAIAPGPLADVLAQFAAIAGVPLSFETELLAGLRSPGLNGEYSVREGFARLLAGSGFQLVDTGRGAYSLIRAPDAATLLQTVKVEATAVSPHDVPAYAGGQVARGGRLGMLGNTDVMDAPFNITSYTAELLENQQARSLADVVANDPSVRSSVSSGSFYEMLMVRGFNLGASEMGFMGLYGLTPITRTSAEFAERVDVIKGPAAMLTGMPPSGGIGGTVSITPKRAADEPLTRLSVGFDARSRAGVHADIGRRFGPDGAFGVRLNGVARDGETAVHEVDRQTLLGSVALDWRGERARLSLDAYDQKEEQDGGGYGYTRLLNRVPDPAKPLVLGSRAEMRDKMALLSGEYDIAAAVTAFARYGWHNTEVLGVRALLSGLDADGNYRGGLTVQNTRGEFQTGDAGLRLTFATGPVAHRVVASVTDYHHENFYAGATAADADYVDGNVYEPTRLPLPAQWPTDRKKSAENSLRSYALADTLAMWDERVQLTLGLRRQQVEVVSINTATGVKTPYDKSATTPAAALVVKPLQNISVYANYIQGLTRGPTAPIGTGLENEGEQFPPFKSKQYEAGVKGEWRGFGTSVSLFQIERPNPMTQDNRFSLDGEQRDRGVEFNVFGEPLSGVRILGGAVFMNAEITETDNDSIKGNRAFGVPGQQINLGGEWDVTGVNGLTLSTRVLRTGSVYLNNTNTVSIPSWTRWDAGTRYAVRVAGKPLVLRANVENLLDKGYWMANDVENWMSISGPRTFMLSATVDF